MKTAPRKQQGFVLLASLVFIIVLTIIVFNGMRASTLYERQANNVRVKSQAFQAAEYALRQAQSRLTDSTSPIASSATDCLAGVCGATADTSIYTSVANWPANAAKTCAIDGTCNTGGNTSRIPLPNVVAQPRYVMQKLTAPAGAPTTCDYYDVFTYGLGMAANSAVILRSTVKACS